MSFLERLNVNRSAIEDFSKRHGIIEMSVFGSAARDELSTQSDVDLMVTFDPAARWDLFDLSDMQDELAIMFGREVDLVESGTIRNPYRKHSIERDLTRVYAA